MATICSKSESKRGIDRLGEICFVGVLSYFEAFCKDHAASVVSIFPDLIEKLRKAGHAIQGILLAKAAAEYTGLCKRSIQLIDERDNPRFIGHWQQQAVRIFGSPLCQYFV